VFHLQSSITHEVQEHSKIGLMFILLTKLCMMSYRLNESLPTLHPLVVHPTDCPDYYCMLQAHTQDSPFTQQTMNRQRIVPIRRTKIRFPLNLWVLAVFYGFETWSIQPVFVLLFNVSREPGIFDSHITNRGEKKSVCKVFKNVSPVIIVTKVSPLLRE